MAFITQNLIWVPLRILFFFFGRLRVENWDAIKRIPDRSFAPHFSLAVSSPRKARLTKGAEFIIISNHISFLDPFLISQIFPFGSKYFPFRYPTAPEHYYTWKRPFIWALGAYPIREGTGLEQSLLKSLEIIGRGGRVLVFPEGRVNRDFKPKLARRGIAYLAAKTGAPILPVYLEGFSPDRYRMGFAWKELFSRKYSLKIVLGEPFFIDKIYGRVPETSDEYAQAAEKAMSFVYRLHEVRNI